MIVLDASLTIEWLFGPPEDAHNFNVALSSLPVLVPGHWALEISNVLRPDLRDRKLSIGDFHGIMERFDRLDIRVQPPLDLDEIGPLAQFAITHGLTTYDAAYVQLALHRDATLASLDNAMRRAAMALNIPLIPAAAP